MEPIAPDTEISLTLRADEVNLVLRALHSFTAPLIDKITAQAQTVTNAAQSSAKPNGEDSHAPH